MNPKKPRWRRVLGWMRTRPWRSSGLTILLAFFVLNIFAYLHARAMLSFSTDLTRTPPPQSLSVGQKISVLFCGITVPRPSNTRSPDDFGLPAKTLSFSTEDGVNLETWILTPPKPQGTVVMFHGYAASRASLLEQAEVCFRLGRSVVLVDFRGSGGSDGNTTSLGYHEANDVKAVVRHLEDTGAPRPFVLYGQSMGGAAVLRSISALDVQPDAVILESVFDRMHGTVRNRFKRMGIPSIVTAELLVFWGGVQIGCSGFHHNPVDYARDCNCPALVLHGEIDQNATVENGQAVFSQLAGNKTMVIFKGVGHSSLCVADHEQWKNVVGEFLSEQETRSSKSLK